MNGVSMQVFVCINVHIALCQKIGRPIVPICPWALGKVEQCM